MDEKQGRRLIVSKGSLGFNQHPDDVDRLRFRAVLRLEDSEVGTGDERSSRSRSSFLPPLMVFNAPQHDMSLRHGQHAR